MVGSDLVRLLLLAAMATLVALDSASAAVYVLAVLLAIAEPVFRSAQAALTPSLVTTPSELTAANVLASGVESVGLFLGPALGALLLALASTASVFAATAALLLVAIILVARIGADGRPAPSPQEDRRHSLLAGWHTILAEPDLRVVIALFSVQALVAGMFNVLVVVLAIQILDLGTPGVGLLDGVVGIGALLAILVAAGLAGKQRLATYFGVGLLLWGLPLALIGATSEIAVVVVLLVLVGVGNTLVDVSGITLLQRTAPDEVLGRVFGAFEALVVLSMGIGALLAPLLVSTIGARGALVVAGLVLPAVLVPLWRRLLAIDAASRSPTEEVKLLRGIPIFAPLPVPEIERLAKALATLRVEHGATVFGQGDTGDHFYVIRAGTAVVEIDGDDVRRLDPGDWFGEIALTSNVPRTATVRARTTLDLLALERDVFVATLTHHPASAEAAGSIVAARLASPIIT